MPSIDINCDMGESFGPWVMGQDLEILPLVTSANIACGFHASDPDTMLKTVRAAIANGVALGAHPGLPDRQGFGRRAMDLSAAEVYALMVYQIGALQGFAQCQGASLHHVKTHGALYNMTVRQPALADAVAQAVFDVDPKLQLFVANHNMAQAARGKGLTVQSEVFADRSYQDDGTLTPRSQPGAMIEDVALAIAQVRRMVLDGVVRSVNGVDVPVAADTLCLHGDQPGAVVFARRIRAALQAEGITIAST